MKYYDTYEFNGIGYSKLFHHQNWRVAVLNYIEELEVENISYVECHALTDEVFVLLKGSFKLFFAEVVNNQIIQFNVLSLEPNKVYKIPMGIYHAHTLSKDAQVLIVEEENTSYDNSPRIYFGEREKALLKHAFKESIE